jgi:hypothetical protein
MGKKGVAVHLAKICPAPRKYFRVETRGVARSLQHYYIAHPQMAEIVPLRRAHDRGASGGWG